MAEPFLDRWRARIRPVRCIEGYVEGHPGFIDGHRIVTSEVFAHFQDDGEHFVRTSSRWYRLGVPSKENRL